MYVRYVPSEVVAIVSTFSVSPGYCSLDDELEGYTPESRLATHRYMEKKRNETGKKPE